MYNEYMELKIPTYDDLIIDGNWFSSFGVYVASDKEIELEVLPSKTMHTVSINGMDGESFSSSYYDARVFKLPFYIDNLEELYRFKMLFVQRKPFWLGFKNSNLRLKVKMTSEFKVKPYGNKGLFELEFESFDPYFYEIIPTVREILNPTTIEIYNFGNAESNPIYKVTGKGIVYVIVNGHTMAIKLNETIEETITINCTTFETYSGTAVNRIFDNLNYNFPLLKVGNNTIKVEENCTKLSVQVNPKWI